MAGTVAAGASDGEAAEGGTCVWTTSPPTPHPEANSAVTSTTTAPTARVRSRLSELARLTLLLPWVTEPFCHAMMRGNTPREDSAHWSADGSFGVAATGRGFKTLAFRNWGRGPTER